MKPVNPPRFNLFIDCLSILIFCSAQISFAQEKQKIQTDLFAGKWSGKIHSEIKAVDKKGRLICKGKSSLEIVNMSVEPPIEGIPAEMFNQYFKGSVLTAPIQNSFTGSAIFSGLTEFFDSKGNLTERWSMPNKEENIEIDGHLLKDNSLFIVSDTKVLMKQEQFLLGYNVYEHPDWHVFSMGGSPLFPTRSIKFKLRNGTITIDDIWKEDIVEIKVTGELYRVELLKRTFPKDIKPNEPIKTDKKTQVEIKMPSKDVIKVAQNTELVIKSENLIKVTVGKIYNKIKKFIEQKRRAKFLVNTPTSAVAVRGTEFEISVEDNGTTAVIVFDGEVEFSDKEKKKTVIVKKNQKSVVKPGVLPTAPATIDPEIMLKWWE